MLWTVEHHPENIRKPFWVVGVGQWINPRTLSAKVAVRRWAFDYPTEEAANAALPMREAEFKPFEVDALPPQS